MTTASAPTPESFKAQLAALTAQVAGRPLDGVLDAWLNQTHGAGSPTYATLLNLRQN